MINQTGENHASGPFLQAGDTLLFATGHPHDTVLNPHGEPLPGAARGLLFASAGLQASGAALLLASFVRGGGTSDAPTSPPPGPRLSFAPNVGKGRVGASIGVVGW